MTTTTNHIGLPHAAIELDYSQPNCYRVRITWPCANTDRKDGITYAGLTRDVAERLVIATHAGAIMLNPQIRTDAFGNTFVSATPTVRGRAMNADLTTLGW